MRRRSLSVVSAVAMVVALAASAIPVASAGQSGAKQSRTAILFGLTVSGSLRAADVDCAPPAAGDQLIEAAGSARLGRTDEIPNGVATYVGTVEWTTCFYIHPDQSVTSLGNGTFTGLMKGCGKGTVDMTIDATISAPDPSGVRRLTGKDVFVPGSGTGDLSGVTGQVWSFSKVDNATLTVSDGLAAGYATC